MSENKTIKFDFSVDNNSFNILKQKIDELTRSLKQLADVAKSINLNTGGIAPGGNMGILSGISTHSAQAGQPNGGGFGAKPTNVAGVLTQGLVADKNMFRTVAEGSKEALRAMKDALGQTVDQQTRDIKRLKKEIDELAKSYNKLKGSETTQTFAQIDFNTMASKGKQLDELVKARNENAGLLRRAGAGPLGGMGFLGQDLSPGTMAALGWAGAGLGLAYKAFSYGSEAYYNNRTAVLNEQINGPLDNANQRARVMSSFGGTSLGIRGGDVGLAMGALSAIRRMPSLMKGDIRGARRELAQINAGLTVSPGGIGQGLQDATGAALGGMIDGGTGTSATAIKLKNLYNAIPGDMAEQFNQAAQAYANSDPLMRARANEFYAGAMGGLGLQRAVGIGSMRRNASGQMEWFDAAGRFRQHMIEMGYDPGEAAGAIGAAKFSVGYGNRWKGLGFLNKNWGGFGNAAAVFNAGQQYGNGQDLVNAFAGRGGVGGRGGLDALASSQLADVVMSQMYGSKYVASNGTALAHSLGDVVGSAGTIGGQLRLARDMAGGLNNLTATMAGATDPLQAAINAYAGSKVFNGHLYQMNAMSRLSAGDVISILNGGGLGRLAGKGITGSMVSDYVNEQNRFALSRYHYGQSGSAQDDLVRKIRANGGDPLAFIRSEASNFKGSPKAKNQMLNNLINDVGGAIGDSIGNGADIDISSALRAQLGSSFASVKGRGIGGPGAQGLTKTALGAQAEKQAADSTALEQNQRELNNVISTMGKLPDLYQNLGTGLLAGEEKLTQSLLNLAQLIDEKLLHVKHDKSYYKPIKAIPKTSMKVNNSGGYTNDVNLTAPIMTPPKMD